MNAQLIQNVHLHIKLKLKTRTSTITEIYFGTCIENFYWNVLMDRCEAHSMIYLYIFNVFFFFHYSHFVSVCVSIPFLASSSRLLTKYIFFSQIELTICWIYFWLILQFIFKPLHTIRSTPSTTNSFSIFCVIFLSGISWNRYFFLFYLCVHLHALQYLLIFLSMQT